jgi:hypothetical protein
VWELLCSICIAFLCAFLAFCMHFVSYALVRKASPIYIVHHGMICMFLWACLVWYG